MIIALMNEIFGVLSLLILLFLTDQNPCLKKENAFEVAGKVRWLSFCATPEVFSNSFLRLGLGTEAVSSPTKNGKLQPRVFGVVIMPQLDLCQPLAVGFFDSSFDLRRGIISMVVWRRGGG